MFPAGMLSVAVFPAYAGMNRFSASTEPMFRRVPRIRGDEPFDIVMPTAINECSPHTRG